MVKIRSVRLAVTLASFAATLALSMLPPAHVHESSSGPPIVHRHVADASADHADHSASIDHGDHSGVKNLDPTFVAEPRRDAARPVLTSAPVLVAPERREIGRMALLDDPVAHGPPIRVKSLRAPPA